MNPEFITELYEGDLRLLVYRREDGAYTYNLPPVIESRQTGAMVHLLNRASAAVVKDREARNKK